MPLYGLTRSLADGLAMSFCTQLEERSAVAVTTLIGRHIAGADDRNLLRAPPCPDAKGSPQQHVLFEEFWLEVCKCPPPSSWAVLFAWPPRGSFVAIAHVPF